MKLNDWTPETRSLLKSLTKAGFKLSDGNNGEEVFSFANDLPKFIENLTACDETHLFVIDPDGNRRWLYLVLGNGPGELVCDYSCPKEGMGTDYLDAVTTAHYDKWENKSQPTITPDENCPKCHGSSYDRTNKMARCSCVTYFPKR